MALSKVLSLNASDDQHFKDKMRMVQGAGVHIDKILKNTGNDTVRYTKKQVDLYDAVDTGRLKRNVKLAPTIFGQSILESEAIDPTTGKDYAPTVNDGLGVGRNSVARPYFDNGVRYFQNKFKQNVTALFRLYSSLGASSRDRAAINQIGRR